jgi:hypothetical protein
LAYKKRSETEIQSSQQEREDKTLTSTAKTRSPENKIRRKLRALRAKRKKHERKLANVIGIICHNDSCLRISVHRLQDHEHDG